MICRIVEPQAVTGGRVEECLLPLLDEHIVLRRLRRLQRDEIGRFSEDEERVPPQGLGVLGGRRSIEESPCGHHHFSVFYRAPPEDDALGKFLLLAVMVLQLLVEEPAQLRYVCRILGRWEAVGVIGSLAAGRKQETEKEDCEDSEAALCGPRPAQPFFQHVHWLPPSPSRRRKGLILLRRSLVIP